MDWNKITLELQKKLDPKHVKPAPQGKYGDYIEGWHAIAEANRIFGEDGWSYVVNTIQLTNSSEDQGKHRVGYMAIVAVTVDAVVRSDVGHGQGFGKSEGDAHDSAVKEAVTDALKRALRTFGNPFGLALYDKTKVNVGVDPEPFNASETRDRIKDAIGKAPNAIKLEAIWKHPKTCEAFEKLHPAMQAELQKAYTDRMAAVYQAPPEAAE